MIPVKNNGQIKTLTWLIVIAIFIRLATLGLYPVNDTTEARYAEIARKMVELNDWITPWFDYGVPFWGKPPLSTWLTAGSFHLFGINEFAARLPYFLTALLISWLMWGWLKQRSVREATLAVALLWATPLFYVSSGAVMMDMTLTAGIVLAMRGFWLGLYSNETQRKRERWLLFIGFSVGLLCKGPIVLVLAGPPIVIWSLFTRNVRFVWQQLPWLSGSLLMALIVLPWYWLAELKTPGFLNYFILGEHWKRFTVSGWTGDLYGHAHAFPHGSIWLFAGAACLTWLLLFPCVAYGRKKLTASINAENNEPALSSNNQHSWALYLLLWGFTPCLFFTMAGNILWTYVLPGLPALAIFFAGWLDIDQRESRINKLVAATLLFTALGMCTFIATQNLTNQWKTTKALVAHYQAISTQHEALVFLNTKPYSAAFYKQGRIEEIKDASALDARLKQSPAFVALMSGQLESLPKELQAKLHNEGAYNGFELFSVR